MAFLHALCRPGHGLLSQALRYLAVGGISFVVDASVLGIATRVFGLHYLYGNALGFLTGVCVNYTLSVRWVFAQRSVGDRRWEIALFIAVGLAGLALSELFMALFFGKLHLALALAKIATTGLVLVWNFGVRKLLLFSDLQVPFKPQHCEGKP